jgi:hypothetical protein
MDEEHTTEPALATDDHAQEIAMFLMDEFKASNDEAHLFLAALAWRIAWEIAREMPTRKRSRR